MPRRASRALPSTFSMKNQPTKSTRTHTKMTPKTKQKSPFNIQVPVQSTSGAKTYLRNKKK